MNTWPKTVEINAWIGDGAATSDLAPDASTSAPDPAYRPKKRSGGVLSPDELPPLWEWSNKQIGWGLILRDGAAIPAPIQALLESRPGSPVLRYMPDTPTHLTHLYNPATNKDIPLIKGPGGIDTLTRLPYYLLIYGTPTDVPWELQYVLNQRFFVGRLDLEGAGLENYVNALINQWGDAQADIEQAVAWSVVQDTNGITQLMRSAVGEQVVTAWQTDKNPRFHDNITFLDGKKVPATFASLSETLHTRKPALIVTTSHGNTGPIGQPQALREHLGVLIDQQGKQVEATTLLDAWQPDGAVWYAHACCSAGSSEHTQFDDQFRKLITPGSSVDHVLKGVAAIGSVTAPFPRALLGAKKPLRAFIGHVEPTFDISLRDVGTGQHLTTLLKEALYNNIYLAKPVGYAFQSWFSSGGMFSIPYNALAADPGQHDPEALRIMLAYQLLHRDRTNTVILGDPTAALPKLK